MSTTTTNAPTSAPTSQEPVWFQTYKKWVAGLNPYQKDIVAEMRRGVKERETRPLIVGACAGAGKTRTLVTGVAAMALQDLPPEQILLATFTKVGGEEMKKRLAQVVEPSKLAKIRVGTIHSHAYRRMVSIFRSGAPARLTQRYPHKFDLDRRCKSPERLIARIVGEPWVRKEKNAYGQWGTVEQEIEGLQGVTRGLSLVKGKFSDPKKTFPSDATAADYSRAIGAIANKGISLIDSPAAAKAACAPHMTPTKGYQYLPELHRVWEIFETALGNLGQWTFDQVLDAYYRYGNDAALCVICDEGQDNNPLQLMALQDVAKRGGGRFMLIGDVSQSIYGFQGAAPEIMADLAKDPETVTMLIPTNYRSGRRIVELGNEILREASWEPRAFGIPAKRGILENELPGGSVSTRTYALWSEAPEAIMAEINRRMREEGHLPQHFAILSRSNIEGEAMELAAYAAGIPAVRVGQAVSFFDRAIVADTLAYLTLTERDDMGALGRICNLDKRTETGTRYLGEAKVRDVLTQRRPKTLDEAFRAIEGAGINRNGVAALRKSMEEIRTFRWSTLGGVGLLNKVWPFVSKVDPTKQPVEEGEAGLSEEGVEEESASALMEQTAYSILSTLLAKCRSLDEALSHIAKLRGAVLRFGNEVDTNLQAAEDLEAAQNERMTISTIHRSKGREFPIVYLSAASGKLPSIRAVLEGNVEEEQRLFYVGVTRAEDELVLYWADKEERNGSILPMGPSQFVEEYALPYMKEDMAIVRSGIDLTERVPWAVGDTTSDTARAEGRLAWEGITLVRQGDSRWGQCQWENWTWEETGKTGSLVELLGLALASLPEPDPQVEEEVPEIPEIPPVASVEPVRADPVKVSEGVVDGEAYSIYRDKDSLGQEIFEGYHQDIIVAMGATHTEAAEETVIAIREYLAAKHTALVGVQAVLEGAPEIVSVDPTPAVEPTTVPANRAREVGWVRIEPPAQARLVNFGFSRITGPWNREVPHPSPWPRHPLAATGEAHVGLSMEGAVYLMNGMDANSNMVLYVYEVARRQENDPPGRLYAHLIDQKSGPVMDYPKGFVEIYERAHQRACKNMESDLLSKYLWATDGGSFEVETGDPTKPAASVARLRILYEISNACPIRFGSFYTWECPNSYYHARQGAHKALDISASHVNTRMIEHWRAKLTPPPFVPDAADLRKGGPLLWSEMLGGIPVAPQLPKGLAGQ